MWKRTLAATVSLVGLVAGGLSFVGVESASAATVPAPVPSCTATRSGNGADLATRPTPNDGGSPIKWYAFGIAGVTGVQHTSSGSDLTLAWSGVIDGTEQFRARAVNSVGFSTWTNCSWASANQPPSVSAGADQVITLPSGATLNGTVTDDGLPAGSTVTQTWAKVSGPGTVTFANASAQDTTATFSVAGTYVLSLTASDGALSSSDSMTTTVKPAPAVRPYIPYSSTAWMKQTIGQLGLTQNSTKTSAMRSYINSHDPNNAPNIQGLGTGWGSSWGGVVDCSGAVYKIGTGTVPSQNAFLKTTGFHASAQMAADLKAAASTGATDLPFEAVDRCGNSTFPTGFTVKGGHAAVVGGAGTAANPYVLNVLSAGAYGNDTNGLDGRVAGSNGPNNWSSRGVIAASATIRADEVKYGIDNASDLGQRVELFWWETDSSAGMISPPMAGFESGQAGWGAEGQVVGVSPSFVPAASCTAGEKVIVRTLQTYGAYIGDNAGAGGTSLKGEQDHGQWTGLGLSQQGLATDCGLTWNDFVAY